MRFRVPAATGTYTVSFYAVGHDGTTKSYKRVDLTVIVSGAADTAAPTISTTTPANGATGVTTNSSVTINWNEPIDCATVSTTNITINNGSGWTLDRCTSQSGVFLTSAQAASTTYTVTVGTGVKDISGNAMTSANFSYTTAGGAATPPDTAITAPTASAVLSGSSYSITGTATAGTNPLGSVLVSTDGGSTYPNTATGTASWSWSWTLPAEDYVAHTIMAKARDNQGTPLEDPIPASVSIWVDTVAPAGLANSSPANGASGVATATSLAATAATDGSASVSYLFELATDAGFTAGLQNSGWQAGTTWAPSLAGSTTYYWRVSARDGSNNTAGPTAAWSFTTVAAANNPPGTPGSLAQYKNDGTTPVTAGTFTNSASPVMKGAITDPDGNTVQLEVEVQPIASAFTDTPNCTSGALVASGSTAQATCNSLADGRYKWQARSKDSVGATSAWVQY